MKYISIIVLLLLGVQLIAQEDKIRYEDHTYLSNIKTVQMHPLNLPISLPIYNTQEGIPLRFAFDDLDGDFKNYVYTLIHCDRNWQPSDISDLDYLDGYTEDNLDDYEFSYKTAVPYTHYELMLPNDDMSWTLTGNYLLVVYEDEDEKRIATTRRFVVFDPIFKISVDNMRSAKSGQTRTHQEFDFSVLEDDDNFPVRHAQREMALSVMQNTRWDNAILAKPPSFNHSGRVFFDYQGELAFPAGKEFRSFDMRSLRTRALGIESIENYEDSHNVMLQKDRDRSEAEYFQRQDLSGSFFIENIERRDGDQTSDYANVLFTVAQSQPLYGIDIYVVGNFNNWTINEDNRMKYNPAINAYVNKQLIKQGFYDYTYICLPNEEGKKAGMLIDPAEIEGNWAETDNEYSAILYYRPLGALYDQAVGALFFSSRTPLVELKIR